MKPSHHKVPGACELGPDDLPAEVCQAVGDVLARVGDKWSILVVHMLSKGSLRFSELKRCLGSISQKMLTSTLRGLERDGFLTRHVTPTAPPRVDYQLTALGHDVLAPVTALATWAYLRRHDVATARSAFDVLEQADQRGGSAIHRLSAAQKTRVPPHRRAQSQGAQARGTGQTTEAAADGGWGAAPPSQGAISRANGRNGR